MRRAVIMLLVLAGLMAAPAAAQSPSFIKDSASDGKGPLDVVRVALGPRKDGRLRGEITMEKAWTTADLRASAGPAGSVCLQLYTKRVPGEDPPDYLVCASPSASGDELRGRVLRDRANGPPRLVSVATITRPSTRTVYLRFDQVAIKRPTHVRFAGEAVTRGAKCPKPLGCRDTGPDAPGTRNLTLHSASASG
jgi:hypothetical protein